MSVYKDKTFCSSPNCKNQCNRKMTDQEFAEIVLGDYWTSSADFCDKDGNLKEFK